MENQEAHIVNGHIPVKAKEGESPIRANGKLLVIDGGFAKSYQEKEIRGKMGQHSKLHNNSQVDRALIKFLWGK